MEKKHLAIICGVLYPEPSPTGLCAKRFAELLRDDFDIDMICISTNGISEDVQLDNGIKIHTLSGGVFGAESRSKGLIKKLLHQIGRVQIKSQMLGNLKWFEKAALKRLKDISKSDGLDSVFSICSPFAAHTAANKYKRSNPNVHWCAYTVDPYSTKNRVRPIGMSLNHFIKIEREILMSTDYLLLSDEVYSNRKELFEEHLYCDTLPYIMPDIDSSCVHSSLFKQGEINCVYAGRFYEDIRNPKLLLTTFSKFVDDRIKLYLFSSGCDEIVDEYTNKYRNIIKMEQVAHSEMCRIYNKADILVSVSNTTSEFLPSKTFEYIASGKPIINFNSNETDKVTLSNYPLRCFVEDGINTENIESFIVQSKGKKVSRDEIERIYARHLKESVKKKLTSAMV